MLINLSDVLTEQHRPVEENVCLEMEKIDLRSGSYPIRRKDPIHILVTHIQGKELEIHGKGEIAVAVPCDRCLQEVEQILTFDFTKHVDLGISGADLPEGIDESDYIEGYHLDVDKLLFHEILIGWPTKVLCREDCKGICNVCGQNLNEGTCNCEDTGLDPRMSVVRDLFKNFKEV